MMVNTQQHRYTVDDELENELLENASGRKALETICILMHPGYETLKMLLAPAQLYSLTLKRKLFSIAPTRYVSCTFSLALSRIQV